MAQDFDFTVRATDDQGSFADRNFSITVNNTVVARFVAVSSSAVLHSNDGKEWIRNDALSAMQDVTFGNGRWMIPRTNMTTYQSTDGVNWTEQAYTYTNPGSMLNSSRALYTTRWDADSSKWYGLALGSNVHQFLESSDDGVTWTYLGGSGGANTTTGSAAFHKVGNTVVIREDDAIRVSTDSGVTWDERQTGLTAGVAAPRGQVIEVNGVWFVSEGAGIWRSFDTTFWTEINTDGISGMVYANGELVYQRDGGGLDINVTVDAGDNFTSYNAGAPTGQTNCRRNMAFYGGLFVIVPDNTAIMWSTNPTSTWTSSTAGNTNGNILDNTLAVGVRI